MAFDSKPSNPDPPNIGQVISSDDNMETTGKLMEDYYKANIDHNHPNLHMIQEIVKDERRALHSSIKLFNRSKLPYS